MRHLRNAAIDLCHDLRANGLNGVEFYYAQPSDPTNPDDDDMGREAAEAWDRDYVSIYLGVDPFALFDGCESEYVETHFDHSKFQRDLRAKFAEHLGQDVVDMKVKLYRNDLEIYINESDNEFYRRLSPWHDFDGNQHDEPFDPLKP